jgi:hypothetical protein
MMAPMAAAWKKRLTDMMVSFVIFKIHTLAQKVKNLWTCYGG